jgi:hypothetical protein
MRAFLGFYARAVLPGSDPLIPGTVKVTAAKTKKPAVKTPVKPGTKK